MKEKFIIIDGLDGVGKGVIEDAILSYEVSKGKGVFDSIEWCKDNPGSRPSFDLIKGNKYDIIKTGEPTYSCLGLDIRNSMIANKNKGLYSSESLSQAYAIDREVQMKNIVVPSILNNFRNLQSRSLITSVCYQGLNAMDEGKSLSKAVDNILKLPGNEYQLAHFADLVIIPTIGNIEELILRLEKRIKKDDAIFENIEFQRRAKPLFESNWVKDIIESHGGKVAYLDAGISVQSSQEQALEIYKFFNTTGDIPEKFINPSWNYSQLDFNFY